MKKSNILCLLSLGVLLAPTTVFGQSQTPSSVPPIDYQVATLDNYVFTTTAPLALSDLHQISPVGPPKTVPPPVTSLEALQNLRIPSLELTGVDSSAALTELLKLIPVSYDFAPEFYRTYPSGGGGGGLGGGSNVGKPTLNLPPRIITLRLENTRLGTALTSLTKAIGIQWDAETTDGQVMIHFVPSPGTLAELPVQQPRQGQNFGEGGSTLRINGVTVIMDPGNHTFVLDGGLRVPVKLDVKDASVRDILKMVSEQVQKNASPELSVAVDDTVAADLKRSFTFENVSVKTALDAICESAGLGWRAEILDNGKTILLRVSKQYAPAAP
jgi:hypothetical protein